MKKQSILLILLIVSASPCVAQTLMSKTLYYDSDWRLVSKSDAVFYRECTLDSVRQSFSGEVKDYTIDGKLLMTGLYKVGEKAGTYKAGVFTFYYPNGQIESQGNITGSFRTGTWNYFHHNGKPFRQVEFSLTQFNEESFFVNYEYDSSGAIQIKEGTGPWSFSYKWLDVPQKFIVSGNLVKGKKDGEWTCRLSNGEFLYKEIYAKGKWKSGYFTNADGSSKQVATEQFRNEFVLDFKFDITEKFSPGKNVYKEDYPFLTFLPTRAKQNEPTDPNKIFMVVETPPNYPGGMEAANKFIYSNLKYPTDAFRKRIEGSVFVQFVIEVDGRITQARVMKGISESCDAEALRVIQSMPNWIPGSQSGKNVRVSFVYPVRFRRD